MFYGLQLKTEPGLSSVMDGMNVKSLEERSEGDVASPSSTGTQVCPRSHKAFMAVDQFPHLLHKGLALVCLIRTLSWVSWMAETIWIRRTGSPNKRPSMKPTATGRAATRSLTRKTNWFM